jgi:hypothetical protein
MVDILRSGRSIGVLGVRSPYVGVVTDIPNQPNYAGARERPLFFVMVGPADRVEAFREGLMGLQSPAFSEANSRFSLFTATPFARAPNNAVDVQNAGDIVVAQRPDWVEETGLAGLPAFRVDQSNANRLQQAILRAALDGGETPAEPVLSVAFDLKAMMRPGAVLVGNWSGATQVFEVDRRETTGECSPDEAFTAMGPVQGQWQIEGAPPAVRFAGPIGAEMVALPTGVYLVVATVSKGKMPVTATPSEWMEEWALSGPRLEALRLEQPRFVGALNLDQFARILADAVDEAVAQRPLISVGYVISIES